MRFSDIPLWRRVLIVVVTMAIGAAAYWATAALVAVTPLWVDAVLAACVIGFCVFAIGHDRRMRRRMEAAGLVVIEQRRPRWPWSLFLLSFVPLGAMLLALFIVNAETFSDKLAIAAVIAVAAIVSVALYKGRAARS